MLDYVPLLPVEKTIPSGATYNTLARLLKFLDTDTPDALQVKLNPSGGLRLTITPSMASAATEETYSGPFAVKQDGNTVAVSPGFVSFNGEWGTCPGAVLAMPLRATYICVYLAVPVSHSNLVSITGPYLHTATPSANNFPVAYWDGAKIHGSRTPVASFIFTTPAVTRGDI